MGDIDKKEVICKEVFEDEQELGKWKVGRIRREFWAEEIAQVRTQLQRNHGVLEN